MKIKLITYLFVFNLFTHFSNTVFSQYVYSWFPVTSGTTNDLNFVNDKFCVGSGGTILYTNNGGLNWTLKNSGTSATLNCIYSLADLALAAGASGLILVSTDNGNNWVQANTGISNNLYSVARAYLSNFIAVGSNGAIIISTNSGLNWSPQQSHTSNDLKSISFFGYNGWAVGSNGTLVITTNTGVNWVQVSTGTNANLNCIMFRNLYTGWIVGSGGTVLKSTNGGLNWVQQQSGTNVDLKSIYVGASFYAWVCGANGTVLRSSDGGESWINMSGFTGLNLNSIFFGSYEVGSVVGSGGNIFMRRISDTLYYNTGFFNPNNISTWLINKGIFNQDIRTSNTPGFQWPAGSGKFAIFTSGLTVAAKVNGILRMSAASYNGEYFPGHVADSSGHPVGRTDTSFRFYRIRRGDSYLNNYDWVSWGQMVPYGAPFVDFNHNGIYEPAIDTPGIRGASQTIFICLTDGFPEKHSLGEGFGGGTLPLYNEIHLTAWGYDNPGYGDMQFLKFVVINKNTASWNNTYFAFFCDPDLGYPDDDYIGCDTTRNLGYCYNGDNDDEGSIHAYGPNPPAVGFKMMNCESSPGLTMKSFVYCTCVSCPSPPCENDPNAEPEGAYKFMKGVKKDGTPWVVPNTNPPQTTKFCYSGDPETQTGWTEPGGQIWNCNMNLTGQFHIPPPGDRKFIMGSGSEDFTVNPGDTQTVLLCQFIARGTSNLNSVTRLKQLSDVAQRLCDSGFVIGVNQISSNVPGVFMLYQNYPNPFNPVTNIKYDVPYKTRVTLKIYDVTGREVEILVNEVQNAGTYNVDWNAEKYASGIYFYKLESGEFAKTKKMVLIK
jgi:photosystem II stability/assembly factor-like uncharacterized protein